jgi:microcystin-dependent protein
MSDPFIGQIMQVGFNFAPSGWALCAGQQMSIAQNNALFALLGTTYGGNGTSTFQLPDLQGRVGVGVGNSPVAGTYVIGQIGGTPQTSLTLNNLPQHNHTATFTPTGGGGTPTVTVNALDSTAGNTSAPQAGSILASLGVGNVPKIYAPAGTTGTPVALGGVSISGVSNGGGTVAVGMTGNSQPVSIMQPYLALTTIIALQGIFPSRS